MTGRHSVMLRPDSVRRVRPPKTTMPKTLAELARSQYATEREEVAGQLEGEVGVVRRALEVMLWLRALRGDVDDWGTVEEEDCCRRWGWRKAFK